METNLKDNSEESLEEQNALASGNVVGYTGPLGMDTKPIHKSLWGANNKKKLKTSSGIVEGDQSGYSEFLEALWEEVVGQHHEPDFEGEAMPGLWKGTGENVNSPVKTDSPELKIGSLDEVSKLMDNPNMKRLYKRVGSSKARLGSETYVQSDSNPHSKKIAKLVLKNMDKTRGDSLKDPSMLGNVSLMLQGKKTNR